MSAWLKELADHSLTVVDSFFTDEEWTLLQAAYRRRFDLGRFKRAGVGHLDPQTHSAMIVSGIRGDSTCWVEESDPDLEFLQNKFFLIRQAINETLFLNLADQEFHFAHYEEGAFYRRHLDSFQTDNRRVVSLVVYLNDAWEAGWGGELRTHLNPVRDILPAPNRAVFFLSAEVPHEVLATTKPRKSLTGWFRSRQ